MTPTPTPTPSPIYVVMQSSSGTDWWSPSVLVPLSVAMLALGGVVWSTWHNARQNRIAEDRRAATTITAEDARAAAALAAEDRRHENTVEAERQRYVIEARHEFYARLEGARRTLLDAISALRSDLRDDGVPTQEHRDVLRASVRAFGVERRQAGLYASRMVEKAAQQAWLRGARLDMAATGFHAGFEGATREEMVLWVDLAHDAATDLQNVLRTEVGVKD